MKQQVEQKAIRRMKQKLIFSILWSITLIACVVFYILPEWRNISSIRAQTQEVIQTYEKYKKTGPSIEEIITQWQNKEVQSILSTQQGRDFFFNYYINPATDSEDYTEFLKNKYKTITGKQSQNTRDAEVSRIIPYFNQWFSVFEEENQENNETKNQNANLSHFSFINYIERLLYTFQLQNDSPLWVQAVYPVNTETNEIESMISYIPIHLNLRGQRSDIVDFLWFMQEVAKIRSVENNTLFIKEDVVISDRDSPKYIIGQEDREDYNIYENQLVDIQEIFFPKHLDESSNIRHRTVRTPEDFINFIKSGRGGEYENLEMQLRFYVRSHPIYKIENYIQSVVTQYDTLHTQLTTNIAEPEQESTTRIDYENLLSQLEKHRDTVNTLRNTNFVKRNLDSNYQNATVVQNEIKTILQQIQ